MHFHILISYCFLRLKQYTICTLLLLNFGLVSMIYAVSCLNFCCPVCMKPSENVLTGKEQLKEPWFHLRTTICWFLSLQIFISSFTSFLVYFLYSFRHWVPSSFSCQCTLSFPVCFHCCLLCKTLPQLTLVLQWLCLICLRHWCNVQVS